MKKCLMAVLAAFALGAQAATWYVATEDNGGSDNNSGIEAAPYKTIAKAVKQANAGDTILVGEGLYEISSCIVIAKAVTVKGATDADGQLLVTVKNTATSGNVRQVMRLSKGARIESLILSDGVLNVSSESDKKTYRGSVLQMSNAVAVNCVIQNGRGLNDNGHSVGVFMDGSYDDTDETKTGDDRYLCRLENCIVRNNYNRQGNPTYTGGGVHVLNQGLISNCVISNNLSRSAGGGIAVSTNATSSAIIRDTIIYGNYSGYGTSGGIVDNDLAQMTLVAGNGSGASGVWGGGGGATMVNCLVAANKASLGGDKTRQVCGTVNSATLYGCTVINNAHLDANNQVAADVKPHKFAGLYDCVAYNSIVWGNVSGVETTDQNNVGKDTCSLSYCCLGPASILGTAADQGDNLAVDPEFTEFAISGCGVLDGFTYAFDPTNEALYSSGSLSQTGGAMTDLVGQPRALGTAPDRGCIETPIVSEHIVAALAIPADMVTHNAAGYLVTVSSRGSSRATWADCVIKISASANMSDPIYSGEIGRAENDNDSFNGVFENLTLLPETDYYAQLIVSNDAGQTVALDPILFTTASATPKFTIALDESLLTPAVTVNVSTFGGAGATRLVRETLRLYATEDCAGNPVAEQVVELEVAALDTDVSGFVFWNAHGLVRNTTYYIRVVAEDNAGAESVSQNILAFATPDGGDNVWANNTADVTASSSYVYDWVPTKADKLFFESPATVQPRVNTDVEMPALRFCCKDGYRADIADGAHSAGYVIDGSGTMTFTQNGDNVAILQRSAGTVTIKTAMNFNPSSGSSVKVLNANEGELYFEGPIASPSGKTLILETQNLHVSGSTASFLGSLQTNKRPVLLSLDSVDSFTNVEKITVTGGWNDSGYVVINNGTSETITLKEIATSTGWDSSPLRITGSPVNITTYRDGARATGFAVATDVAVENLVILKNNSNVAAELRKSDPDGLLTISGSVTPQTGVRNAIAVSGGCLHLATADAWLPGRQIMMTGQNERGTIGLDTDYRPVLDGENDTVILGADHQTSWGFTAFGGDRTVCYNSEDYVIEFKVGTSNLPRFSDTVTVADYSGSKTISEYYAVPKYFVFGHRSALADGTVLFKNPISYIENTEGVVYVESFGSVVAARLQGSLSVDHPDRSWTFDGNDVGGTIAVESDNSEYIGRLKATKGARLLVNGNQRARKVTVENGSALGGTGCVTIYDASVYPADSGKTGEAVQILSGGTLFGGEFGKGGCLTIDGKKLMIDSGAKLGVEIAKAGAGFVKLAADLQSVSWPAELPVVVTVAEDANQNSRVKVLDWSANPAKAPSNVAFSVANADALDFANLKIEDEALWLRYRTKNAPKRLVVIIR